MTDVSAVPPSARLARDPADHVAAYVATFALGSAELLDQHYEPDAILLPRPGHTVTGTDRVEVHRHLLGFGLPLDARLRQAHVAGDIALLIVDWSMRGTSRQGYPIDLGGTATDVARRGADGYWRYVVDNPYGTGILTEPADASGPVSMP